jgi:hypothetical protein
LSAPILRDAAALKRIYEGHGHMKSYSETAEKYDLGILTRIIHLGLMIFGLLAWFVSRWAGKYEHQSTLASHFHMDGTDGKPDVFLYKARAEGRWLVALHHGNP